MEEKKKGRKKEGRKDGKGEGREEGRILRGREVVMAPEEEACWQRWEKKYLTERRKPARALQGGLGLTYKVLQVARTSKALLFQNAAPKAPRSLAPDAVADLVPSSPYPSKASSCLLSPVPTLPILPRPRPNWGTNVPDSRVQKFAAPFVT